MGNIGSYVMRTLLLFRGNIKKESTAGSPVREGDYRFVRVTARYYRGPTEATVVVELDCE
jgi:hypothetical protein